MWTPSRLPGSNGEQVPATDCVETTMSWRAFLRQRPTPTPSQSVHLEDGVVDRCGGNARI